MRDERRGDVFCDMGRRGDNLRSFKKVERLNVAPNTSPSTPVISGVAVSGLRRALFGGDGMRNSGFCGCAVCVVTGRRITRPSVLGLNGRGEMVAAMATLTRKEAACRTVEQ